MQEPDPAETTRFPALAHRDFRVLWLGMLRGDHAAAVIPLVSPQVVGDEGLRLEPHA